MLSKDNRHCFPCQRDLGVHHRNQAALVAHPVAPMLSFPALQNHFCPSFLLKPAPFCELSADFRAPISLLLPLASHSLRLLLCPYCCLLSYSPSFLRSHTLWHIFRAYPPLLFLRYQTTISTQSFISSRR